MSSQHAFYLERATEARVSARATTLDNVRDRWLLSEARWTELAARSARSDQQRAIRDDEAAQRAAMKVAI